MNSRYKAFVDLETTGFNFKNDAIVEIAIILLEDDIEVERFQSLVQPEDLELMPAFSFSGISTEELKTAPTFGQLLPDIYDLLQDRPIFAHNARFDYSFLKDAYKKENSFLQNEYCCTLKLSRYLFPHFKRHGLDAIIERFNIDVKSRHRALDDIDATVQFYLKAKQIHGDESMNNAIMRAFQKVAVPANLLKFNFNKISKGPGVYIFENETGFPIYIGKSKSIRKRVYSHFYHDTVDPKEMKLTSQVKNINTVETAGDLGAQIRESLLIKKLKPMYNFKLRDNKGLAILKLVSDDSGYIRTAIDISDRNISSDDMESIISVAKSKIEIQRGVEYIIRQYQLCPKLLGIEKSSGACFNYHLKKCKGACIEKESVEEYNQRAFPALQHLQLSAWPFDGSINITEQYNDLVETISINKWCITDHTMQDSKYNELTELEVRCFDLDIYKILQTYISDPANAANISELGF